MNAQHQHRRTSAILQSVIDHDHDDTISIREFTTLVGDRAFALVILVFSLPNSLPVPGIPGFSTITGLPILFIGIQMLLGRDVIWLPKWLAEKEFSMASLKKVLGIAIPYVIKLERVLKPRLPIILSPLGERVVGLWIVVLTCILVLPIPGGNFLPGLSITILALSFLEKDGLATLLGLIFSAASLVFMIEIIKLGFKAMVSGFHKLFS